MGGKVPNTKRANEKSIKDFVQFTGIQRPEEFRLVTSAHVIAWRDDLGERILNGTTIRHRLAALSSLFQYLCDKPNLPLQLVYELALGL
jgi:integrase/recombinase XerD